MRELNPAPPYMRTQSTLYNLTEFPIETTLVVLLFPQKTYLEVNSCLRSVHSVWNNTV
jgi:hypothetical protein